MYLLYDIRDWFYECDRFLFLAEVHYCEESVDPSDHKFIHEMTSTRLEQLLGEVRELTDKNDYCISVDAWISREEFFILKTVLDNISSGNWNKMDADCVSKAQDVVHKLTNAVNEDILEICNIRGYPKIFNACKII